MKANNLYTVFLRILRNITVPLIVFSFTSCADTYPDLSNSGLLAALFGQSPVAGSSTSASLYLYNPQTIITSESGSITNVSVTLKQAPSSNVTISFTSSDTSEGTVVSTDMVFTSGNFSVAQILQVQGVDDALTDGHISYTIDAAVSTTDSVFLKEPTFSISSLNIDNEMVAVVPVNTSGLITTELFGTASFQVVLSSAPTSDVTVGPIRSMDSTEGTVNGEPLFLIFTPVNWNTPQTIIVTGQYDADLADQTYSISLGTAVSADTAWNLPANPSVSVLNTDVILEVVMNNSGTVTNEDGSCQWLSFHLSIPPASDVTLGPITSLDATEGYVSGGPVTLTFNPLNWNMNQWVTVCGTADADTADQSYDIDLGITSSADAKWNAVDPGNISFTNTNTWPPSSILGSVTVNGGYTVFAVSAVEYVTFAAVSGTTYNINWDDSADGTATYTANILAGSYYSDRTVIFQNINNGYISGQIFTASQTGTVYIKLDPAFATGNTAVSVSTVTLPAGLLANFEGGMGGFISTGLWHISSVRASSGIQSARFADDVTGINPLATFDTGAIETGELISPAFTAGTTLSFDYYLDGECGTGLVCSYDKLTVHISNVSNAGPWTQLTDLTDTGGLGMQTKLIDISAYSGQIIYARFLFDSGDPAMNGYEGAYIDNIRY
jgi:hypothetical protein